MSTSTLWNYCDKTVRVITRIRPIKRGESHLFCVALHRYLGREFTVNGVRVHRFDQVIELHLDNMRVAQLLHENHNLVSLAIKLIQEVNQSLPHLADCVNSQKYRKANVLLGITMIHRGVEKFGFEVFPLHNKIMHAFIKWYLRNIYCTFNSNGNSLIQSRPETFIPKMVAISKQRLIQSYGIR